jgi:hypothetical protein
MLNIIEKIFIKLGAILQTVQGWAIALGLFLAEYFFGSHAAIVWLVLVVTTMDAVWGVAVSVKHGQFTLSELLRLTIAKYAVYGCAMAVFIGLDRLVGTEITATAVGIAIVLVEFWSTCGSMLILFPNMAVLQLLRKALTGEIAAKLRIEPDEVEKVLNEKDKSHERR